MAHRKRRAGTGVKKMYRHARPERRYHRPHTVRCSYCAILIDVPALCPFLLGFRPPSGVARTTVERRTRHSVGQLVDSESFVPLVGPRFWESNDTPLAPTAALGGQIDWEDFYQVIIASFVTELMPRWNNHNTGATWTFFTCSRLLLHPAASLLIWGSPCPDSP